jgi:hypothetical protein
MNWIFQLNKRKACKTDLFSLGFASNQNKFEEKPVHPRLWRKNVLYNQWTCTLEWVERWGSSSPWRSCWRAPYGASRQQRCFLPLLRVFMWTITILLCYTWYAMSSGFFHNSLLKRSKCNWGTDQIFLIKNSFTSYAMSLKDFFLFKCSKNAICFKKIRQPYPCQFFV